MKNSFALKLLRGGGMCISDMEMINFITKILITKRQSPTIFLSPKAQIWRDPH